MPKPQFANPDAMPKNLFCFVLQFVLNLFRAVSGAAWLQCDQIVFTISRQPFPQNSQIWRERNFA